MKPVIFIIFSSIIVVAYIQLLHMEFNLKTLGLVVLTYFVGRIASFVEK